jgi:glutathione S-transferase
MKIMQTKQAPNPRRVRVYLAEKAIEVPYEEIDLMKGELKTPEFTRLNAFQRVPVLLLDDGTAISETMAICRYFEASKPEPSLFGKDPLGIAKVEMWNRRMELGLMFHVSQAFRHLHPAMAHLEVPQVAAWGEANKTKVLEVLSILDETLGQTRYVAGDDYTVADITAMVAIDFMKPARIVRPESLAHLARWHTEVSSRPSAKA